MSALELLGRWYRAVVPAAIRKRPGISGAKQYLVNRLLGHDARYSSDYYSQVIEPPAASSAGPISQSIVGDLKPRTVVDVGCGTGALLEALRSRGCEVLGLEYSNAALKYCRRRSLEVVKFDLQRGNLDLGRTFDVAISMEVAEHLPESSAARYLELLARLSNTVVFTAAPPGQGGVDHVNEQPKDYWIEKFSALGFDHDETLAQSWSEDWRASGAVVAWYADNLMIFRRAEVPARAI